MIGIECCTHATRKPTETLAGGELPVSVLEHVELWCRVRHASPDNEGSLAGCLLYAPVIIYLQTVLLLFNIVWIREG